MKYISIDIETTGLDVINNNILEIGAIIEDTNNPLPREKCPTFHKFINRDNYNGNPYALVLNNKIFEKILELKKSNNIELLCSENELSELLFNFLFSNLDGRGKQISPAGKNFTNFDLNFLNKLPNFKEKVTPYLSHRQLDPAILFTDFKKDIVPPNLSECKKRAGLPELVTHNALDDAWDVICLLRSKY